MDSSTGGPAGRRQVVASAFVSLDGYLVGPDEDMTWVIDHFDPEMADDIATEMSQWEMFLFGRVTYEIFAAYWPYAAPYQAGDQLHPAAGKEDPRIIEALDTRPKVVFSTTLQHATWQPTRIVTTPPEDEVRRLTTQPGGVINIQGSASIVHTLARADLVDEYRLYLHPVLLGSGKPLFAGGAGRQDLRRTHLKPYDNGVLGVRYRREPGPREV